MTANEKSDELPHISAAASLAETLVRLTSIAAALGGVALYIGYRHADSYYGELGCQWFVSLLSTGNLILIGSADALVIGLAAFVGFTYVTKATTANLVARWVAGFALGGMLSAGVTLLPERFVSLRVSVTMGTIGGLLFATTAGLLIVELIVRHAESGHKWTKLHFSALNLLIVWGLSQMPDYSGTTRAKRDGNPALSELPLVALKEESGNEHWRLVAALEKELLIVALTPRKEDRRFRLIASEDMRDIGAEKAEAPNPRKERPPEGGLVETPSQAR